MPADFAALYISSLNNPLATTFSAFVHEHLLITTVLLLVLYAFLSGRKSNMLPLLLALLLALLLTDLTKNFFNEPRPCATGAIQAKVPCPPEGGMPSGHSAYATIFLLASVGTSSFFFFLPISILIMLSRLYLGIHTLGDIAGGAAFGALLYEAAVIALKYEKEKIWSMK